MLSCLRRSLRRDAPLNPSRYLTRPGHREARRQYSGEPQHQYSDPKKSSRRGFTIPVSIILLGGAGYVAYETYQPFRHATLAVVRCSRVTVAAVSSAIDYKLTFAKKYESAEKSQQATSECHKRSAQRVLKALLANGGIFIKLGQHIAALIMLPKEWRDTMRPLQDQCEPTSYEDIEKMFLSDEQKSISETFEFFDKRPIGVASLAQVHVGRLRGTGQEVAVKLQHPHITEFCDIDMDMVEIALGWVKRWFPEFEFTWLAGEMRENLPKELDFAHEARNAMRAEENFKNTRTSLYIPKIIDAKKRILIMEYIKGGRVDDLQYLADHNIDRNKVSLDLSRIFAKMVHLDGFFHADPHAGNILIRPASPTSRSPYNFDIVLLDHGLYFDLDDDLRINYSHFWLSLIARPSPQTSRDRRKYAKLVGSIDEDLYQVFEVAITGRAMLDDSSDLDQSAPRKEEGFTRGKSMVELQKQTPEELEAIRNAIVGQEGLLLDVFSVLRKLPRRVLMVLKLNDLTRSLDHALGTTHSTIRIFLITAKYCTLAVWDSERQRLSSSWKTRGLLASIAQYIHTWWRFQTTYRPIILAETWMDIQAEAVVFRAWLRGLIITGGFVGAHNAAAGLA